MNRPLTLSYTYLWMCVWGSQRMRTALEEYVSASGAFHRDRDFVTASHRAVRMRGIEDDPTS